MSAVFLKAQLSRVHYAIRLGGAALITGEVGSGKSTALRFATGQQADLAPFPELKLTELCSRIFGDGSPVALRASAGQKALG